MKPISCALCFLAATTLLCSCKHEENMIKKVAYNYSFAMANYRVDEAAQYATEETKNTTLVKAKTLVEAVGEDYVKSDTPATIEITSLNIIDDTTAIAVYHKVTPIKDFSGNLELRKRDGKWLAHTPLKETKVAEPQRPESHKHIVPFEVVKQQKDSIESATKKNPTTKTQEPK